MPSEKFFSEEKKSQDPTLEKDERSFQGKRWLEMKPKCIHVENLSKLKIQSALQEKNIFRK